MKAEDIPLAERRRLEREREAEIREALVRRHFQVMQEQQAIDLALAYRTFQLLPGLMDELQQISAKRTVQAAAVVAPAEPAPAVQPLVPVRPNRPVAAVPGLRANLGLT